MDFNYDEHEMEIVLFEDDCWLVATSLQLQRNDTKVIPKLVIDESEDAYK